MIRSFALIVLRIGLGGLLVYAGTVKALDPAQFASDVRSYQMLPEPMPAIVALYLPWLEIVCGFCLAMRRLYAGSLSIVIVLMVAFTLAISQAAVRGLDITCGCFGKPQNATNFTWLITRDLMILGGLIILAVEARLTGRGRASLPAPEVLAPEPLMSSSSR